MKTPSQIAADCGLTQDESDSLGRLLKNDAGPLETHVRQRRIINALHSRIEKLEGGLKPLFEAVTYETPDSDATVKALALETLRLIWEGK